MTLADAPHRLQIRHRPLGSAITAPGLVVPMLIVLFPLFFAIFTSGFDYTLLHRSYDHFIGLDNYREALAQNYFGESLWVTLKFVVCVVLLEFLIGFTIALMLNAV